MKEKNLMNSNTIKIVEPSKDDMTFLVGETKTLTYIIRNTSDFKIADLIFGVDTLINDGGNIRKTDFEYAVISKSPSVLYPGKESILKVKVTVPLDYKEYITKDDGEKAKQPFRVKLHVKGIEHINEL
jgi:hypothetical protein